MLWLPLIKGKAKRRSHLKSSHLQFIDKPRDFFALKLNDLKRQVSIILKSSKAL